MLAEQDYGDQPESNRTSELPRRDYFSLAKTKDHRGNGRTTTRTSQRNAGHRGTASAGSGVRRLPVPRLQGWKTSDSRISRYARSSNFEDFEIRSSRDAKTSELVNLRSSKTSLNFTVSNFKIFAPREL